MATINSDIILATLKKYWGYESFLSFQEKAIQSILDDNDTLTVLPTGGGKSICFQVPAVILPGTAVVISPLISLMKDQVDALKEVGIDSECINSSQDRATNAEVAGRLRNGTLKLLYISPEMLMTEYMQAMLKSIKISFFAIDEAHCISHWGHDFRAEYRRLYLIKEIFSGMKIHAFTATATKEVQNDIVRELKLVKPHIYIGSVDRTNLLYRMNRKEGDGFEQIVGTLGAHKKQAGIIYCLKRADVDSISAKLNKAGFKSLPYHAGLTDEERKSNQDKFSTEKTDIIVATIAFGMGIDRSNVRFIIHAAMPKSIEHYQQETGRAGRDGLPAYCYMYYSNRDMIIWEFIFGKSGGSEIMYEKLKEMYALCSIPQCRHAFLTTYFGQEYKTGKCNACDFCLEEIDSIDNASELAIKILNGIKDVQERFGAEHVAHILIGKETDNIKKWNHKSLPSFGSLSLETKFAVRAMIDQLLAQHYLVRTGEYYTISITDEGRRLLAGEVKPLLNRPVEGKKKKQLEKKKSKAMEKDWGDVDSSLFESLRTLRLSLADKKHVPSYLIFTDKTLIDMATKKPKTLEEMKDIFGIGETKLRQYGKIFLEAIKENGK